MVFGDSHYSSEGNLINDGCLLHGSSSLERNLASNNSFVSTSRFGGGSVNLRSPYVILGIAVIE